MCQMNQHCEVAGQKLQWTKCHWVCVKIVFGFGSDNSLEEMLQRKPSNQAEESTNQFSSPSNLYLCFIVLPPLLPQTISFSLFCCLFYIISLYSPHTFSFIFSMSLFPSNSATFFLCILSLSTFLSLLFCLQHSCMLICWRRSARCVGFNHPEGWLGGCWRLVCWD